jgi:hypothetical protein
MANLFAKLRVQMRARLIEQSELRDKHLTTGRGQS